MHMGKNVQVVSREDNENGLFLMDEGAIQCIMNTLNALLQEGMH